MAALLDPDPLLRMIRCRYPDHIEWGPVVERVGEPSADRLEKNLVAAARRGRMTWQLADDACVLLLGMHPAEVFGDAWWEPMTRQERRNARRRAKYASRKVSAA